MSSIPFQVTPDAIFFRDLNSGESDSVDVWVHNASRSPLQLRFVLPPNSPFTLTSKCNFTTPPGLDAQATIKYTSKSNRPVKDKLKIICPGHELYVPITATPPSARIVPEKTSISLGTVGVNSPHQFAFQLSNIGVKEGKFTISSDDDAVKFIPASGVILPSKVLEITASFCPKQIGDCNFVINTRLDEASEDIPDIKVTATAVHHSLALTVDDAEVAELDFGTLFFGQKRVISAKVVNRGPYKRSFVVLPPRATPMGGPDSSRSSVSMADLKADDEMFTAMPQEGLLNPYASMEVKFVFDPTPEKPGIDDLEAVFNQYSSIEVVETNQRIDFALTGKAVHHYADVNSIDFNFERSEVEGRTVQTMQLTNKSHFLPTQFEIKPVAHFRFEPSKGTIPVMQSKTINVVFFPRNFGVFETSTTVGFCNGLVKKRINLSGTCSSKNADKKFERIPVWDREPEARFNAEHPNTRYAYDLEHIVQNKEKRQKFDEYITDQAKARESKLKEDEKSRTLRKQAEAYLSANVGQYTEADVKEYMEMHANDGIMNDGDYETLEPHEGLVPPEPPINTKPAPLYLRNPEKFGLTRSEDSSADQAQLRSRHRVHMDDNIPIKKKFKAKASTPAEINECTKPLTPAQQLMVVASHQQMNMGQISVFSTVIKSFTISNNLQQHVLVSLNYEYDELGQSHPTSQVIPPKATAGFDIKFMSRKPQNFLKTIHYTVNGHHTYSFNVVAQVVPIEVQLSRSVMEFRFSPDSISPHIKEFITLQNKSNARAEYTFSGISAPFTMDKQMGHIEPNRSMNVEICYHPTTKSHDEQNVIMSVNGGPSRTLKLIGDTGTSKCSLAKKTVNFGLIPIGIARTQTLKLKNSGEDDAIFTVSVSNPSELQVSPMNGRVTAREFQTLQVTYKSLQAHYFDITATISICGANPLTFNVTGQSELPQVQLQNTEFEFGRVFVGSSASINATLNNVGAIPAILFLDLTNRPDFRIEFPAEFEGNSSISLVSDPTFVTKMESASEYVSNDIPDKTGNEEKDETDETSSGLMYKFILAENSTLNFSLVFQPSEIHDHSFELPFTMMNVIGSSAFHLQPIVSAEGVQAPLAMSTTSINFGVSPVFNPDNPNSRAAVETVTLTNEGNLPLEWHFDEVPTSDVYSVEPMNGKIEAACNQVVHISFTPRQAIPYNLFLPLYVKTEKDESLVGKLQMTGVGSSIPFRVRTSDVCLPIVPLNVKSQWQLYVYNEAFIEAALKVEMPVDEVHFPVKVTFPEGNQLQHTSEKLPVLITFQSPKPISFSTLIALVDEHGNATSFTVTCTADNSCFTIYPFMGQPTPKGKGLALYKAAMEQSELTARFLTVEDVMELRKVRWEPRCSQLTIDFCQRYLNALVLNTQLSNFPADFINSQGSLLMEVIGNLSGGKKGHVEPEKGGSEEKRRDAMKRILHFLISNGALLSSVRPEFLLDRADFMQLMRKKITKQLLGVDHFNAPPLTSFDQQVLGEFTSSKSFSNALVQRLKILEERFNALSVESWMIVLMQVVKLFVISKIDIDRFNSTPGVSDALRQVKNATQRFSNANEVWSEINKTGKALQLSVYSPQEMTLMKWATIHWCNVTGDYTKRVTDFKSMCDSLALAAIIKAHTNIYPENLSDRLNDKAQKEQNAIEVTNSMKDLKLSFCLRAEEIFAGTPCTWAITLGYLYSVLPHYLPTSTVEFMTTLHKPITKVITLVNPSKSEICYRASYEGSNVFEISQETIIVGPNQTGEFPVTFQARTMKTVTGRLSLMPSRPRFVNESGSKNAKDDETGDEGHIQRVPQYSAPVVVDLVSNVMVNAPDLTMTVSGSIYNSTKIPINIPNILNMATSLRVSTKVHRIEDENGKVLMDAKQQLQEMVKFINAPMDDDKPKNLETWDGYVKGHQQFIIGSPTITFEKPDSTASLDIEFVPISLGTYRCLLLFSEDDVGEFVYEIIAKSQLPAAVEVGQGKYKTEAGKRCQMTVQVESLNSSLVRAVAYAIERRAAIGNALSERKFKDLWTRKQRELESLYRHAFTTKKFSVILSAPNYFEAPNELIIYKNALVEGLTSQRSGTHMANTLPVAFKPIKPGDYPCKIILVSTNDVRVFQTKGVGLAATKEMDLVFETVSGRVVKQEIPIHNTSNETWQYKVTVTGDSAFTAPQRVTVKPQSTQMLPVTFSPLKIGTYTTEVAVYNLNKESTLVYKISGTADEPPAEEKLMINCQARSKSKMSLAVKPFMASGTAAVTCTVPIITCPDEVSFANGELITPFTYEVFAPRSGMTAGTLTFTDKQTKNYIWYVIEINVDPPKPEQTIEVNTIARKSETVSIPISNPKNHPARFTVQFMDDDLFGDKEFVVEPHGSISYDVVVSPLKAATRTSAVYFYSDDDGEFWYCIKINAEPAPESTLAPMSAPIGRNASTSIVLENPLEKATTFRVENDNPSAFHVLAKRVIQIGPHEKKRVEIQYIPSSVGVKEVATIGFRSNDTGDWVYKLNGTGKPPQPLSPTIVSTAINNTNSALILFCNPFPYPARFSVSLTYDGEDEFFKFLVRRKVFTLNSYNEEFQIPFTFSPTKLGQFRGHIVVASLGPARGALPELETLPNIRWVYPIIGNSVANSVTTGKTLKCKAHGMLDTKLNMTLVGESESFAASEYTLDLEVPRNYDFIRNTLDVHPVEIHRHNGTTDIELSIVFKPKRPLNQSVKLTVRNPLKQEWQFKLDLNVELGQAHESVTIESLLNKTGTARVRLPVSFNTQTPFHAYFASGSASEFSVSPEHGMLEPTLTEYTEIPVDVTFAPKMYGKHLKGLLVVDTIDSQYLFDIFGKTPEYVPPVVLETSPEMEQFTKTAPDRAVVQSSLVVKKRNIIRENIENCKIVKPKKRSQSVAKSFK